MKRLCLLMLMLLGLLSPSACKPACPDELTSSQCANLGTHEYTRTYDFVKGCGKAPGLIEGLSQATWTFTSEGATIAFAALLPESTPPPDSLIAIGTNIYRPEQQGSLPGHVQLTESGFTWQFFDPDTRNLCYQVIFTLSE